VTSGRQSPQGLCESNFWSGKMADPESADDCVECIIRKWEMFYVSFTKIDRGMQSARQRYHLRRQIDANGARVTICSHGGKRARSGCNVQHSCTCVQMHGVEESVSGEGGHLCKKSVVARCQGVVTLAFEGAESLHVHAG